MKIEIRIGTERFEGIIYMDGTVTFNLSVGGQIIEVYEQWREESIKRFIKQGYINWPTK